MTILKYFSNNNRNPIEQFILVTKLLSERCLSCFHLLAYYLSLFKKKKKVIAGKFEAQCCMEDTQTFQQLPVTIQKNSVNVLIMKSRGLYGVSEGDWSLCRTGFSPILLFFAQTIIK